MAYFDSPKNRALWAKELATLRKEKERRAECVKNGIDPLAGKKSAAAEAKKEKAVTKNPLRERTSYKELLREEAKELRSKKAAVTGRTAQKTISAEMSEPVLG